MVVQKISSPLATARGTIEEVTGVPQAYSMETKARARASPKAKAKERAKVLVRAAPTPRARGKEKARARTMARKEARKEPTLEAKTS